MILDFGFYFRKGMNFLLNNFNIRRHINNNGLITMYNMRHNNMLRIDFACFFFRWFYITWWISFIQSANIGCTLNWRMMLSSMSIMFMALNVSLLSLLNVSRYLLGLLLCGNFSFFLLLEFMNLNFLCDNFNIILYDWVILVHHIFSICWSHWFSYFMNWRFKLWEQIKLLVLIFRVCEHSNQWCLWQ